MTYRIIIELDTSAHHAQLICDAISEWATTGHAVPLERRWLDLWLRRCAPTVTLEDGEPDDDDLLEAVQHLRRLGFDTAAAAVQAARRNLHTATATDPWDDDLAARIEDDLDRELATPPRTLPDWSGMSDAIARNAEYFRAAAEDTERRLHARAAVDTHQARGGRVL